MQAEYCTRCQIAPEGDLLREIAQSSDRSLRGLLRQGHDRAESPMGQRAEGYRDQRVQEDKQQLASLENELKQYQEELSYQVADSVLADEDIEEMVARLLADETVKRLKGQISDLKWKPETVNEEDLRQALEEYEREGYIEIEQGAVKITSKGARKLAARALERILQNLDRKELGSHAVEETGYGAELSLSCRRYEAGDDYSLVNVERTVLNALERRGKLSLEPEDFAIHEETHQTRLCAGLIIDESGSMRSNHKLAAAIETALALSQLIGREPQDSLKVFIFSETVKQIEPWQVVNQPLRGGCTDIRAAMSAFRRAVASEKGDKQAYLITDTEPNAEKGRFVGFDRACAGVTEEAIRYRQQGIKLNLIMLDENPHLKVLASQLARKNLGRAFFTSPLKLGEVVIEDYLRERKQRA